MDTIHTYMSKAFDAVLHYRREVLSAAVLVAGAGVFFLGYSIYSNRQEQAAHRTWISLHEDYVNAPIKSADDEKPAVDITRTTYRSKDERSQAVVTAADAAARQHARTQLAPFFHVLKSEALSDLKQHDAALQALADGIHGMRRQHVRHAYEVKHALMQLDSANSDVVARGLSFLQSVAAQDTHVLHDYVLYQLGSYFWTLDDFDMVKNYWKMLLLKYSQSAEHPSPWAGKVSEKLALIESR